MTWAMRSLHALRRGTAAVSRRALAAYPVRGATRYGRALASRPRCCIGLAPRPQGSRGRPGCGAGRRRRSACSPPPGPPGAPATASAGGALPPNLGDGGWRRDVGRAGHGGRLTQCIRAAPSRSRSTAPGLDGITCAYWRGIGESGATVLFDCLGGGAHGPETRRRRCVRSTVQRTTCLGQGDFSSGLLVLVPKRPAHVDPERGCLPSPLLYVLATEPAPPQLAPRLRG